MAQEHADHRQYEGDFYADTQRKLQQQVPRFGAEDQPGVRASVNPRTENQSAQYSVEQGNKLLHDQATRGDAPAPGQNYPANTHEELFDMVNQNLVPSDLDERGRVANKLGNWLADVSNAANDAVNSSQVQWQGDGAAKAHGFFQNTANYTAETANAAQLSSNRYSQQAAAADYAQKNMPKPSGFNQQAEIDKATKQYQAGDIIGGAQTMNGVAAKQQQAQADHDHAVQVVQGLDSTYHTTAGTQPTYSPPPQLGQGDSTSVSGFHGTGGGGFSGVPEVGTGGNTGSSTGGFTPGTQPPGTTPQPPGGGYVPPGATTGSGTGNLGGTGGFRAPGAPTGGFPGVRPDGLALAGPQGTTPGGGGGDITRGKPGTAGRGFAGSRVSGGGYTPKGAEVEGKGAGSGAAKGGAERLERGATAAANAKTGKPGAPGAAGTGAGKKKDEDKEHKNKLPVTDDEIFEVRPERGPDGEKITPPVIGS